MGFAVIYREIGGQHNEGGAGDANHTDNGKRVYRGKYRYNTSPLRYIMHWGQGRLSGVYKRRDVDRSDKKDYIEESSRA